MSIPNISGTDLNEISNTGIYYGKDMKNAPVDSEMIIEYLKKLNNKDQQAIRIYHSGEIYARFKEDNTWQHWHRYNDKKQLWERLTR